MWTYVYNANGQVEDYEHPNLMKTFYSYDTRSRLYKIEHKDGTTVKESFLYALDDAGNITKTTQADGSYWDYTYDGRYRLITAIRNNKSSPTISAKYAYTYDAGDNLVTKKQPYFDDWNNGTIAAGWSFHNGPFTEANGYVKPPVDSSWKGMYRAQTDGNNELRFSYQPDDTNGYILAYPRYKDTSNYVAVYFTTTYVALRKGVSGTHTWMQDNTSAGHSSGVKYNVRIVADGENVYVYRGVDGQAMTLICSTSPPLNVSDMTTTDQSRIDFAGDSNFRIDDYQLVSTNSSGTVAYAYTVANELTKMTDVDGDTMFTYDAWGRTVSKYRAIAGGSVGAAYAYKYGSKLSKVTSTMYDEGTVTYNYRVDGKRHTRQVGAGAVTTYNWEAGWNMVSEQVGSTLTRTYVGDLAHVDGATPSSGAYAYYMHDNLGSTRALYNQSKVLTDSFEYDPYGGAYLTSGAADITYRYTGHTWDSTSQLYYAPYRYYSAAAARWMTRDPMGMVDGPNRYAYVKSRPINIFDLLGLAGSELCIPLWSSEKVLSEELLTDVVYEVYWGFGGYLAVFQKFAKYRQKIEITTTYLCFVDDDCGHITTDFKKKRKIKTEDTLRYVGARSAVGQRSGEGTYCADNPWTEDEDKWCNWEPPDFPD